MRLRTLVLNLAAATALAAPLAHAESSLPTAEKPVEISTFAGLNAAKTGFDGGKNLGVTAGIDVGLLPIDGFRPFIEGRATYPVDGGQVVKEKNALGGLRLERTISPRLRFYGDFLFGRDVIHYENGGYPVPGGQFRVLKSLSSVYSPGFGAEYNLTEQVSALVDLQFQHYATPAISSGVWSESLTVGARYWFNLNRHRYPDARW